MAAPIEELKNKAFAKLKEKVIEVIEEGEVTEEEVENSANFITYHLTPVEGAEELMLFLKDLVQRWKFYETVYLEFEKEFSEEETKSKLSEVKNQLNNFKN